MPTRNTIVVTTDFSEASLAALSWARKMSEVMGAEVHCVTAIQEFTMYVPLQAGIAASYPSIDEIKRATKTQLDKFVREHLSGLATPPVAAVLIGRTASEIVRYADEIKAQMIVMATHGRSGLAHTFIGSTTEEVVRHAKCPVLSIRSS